MAKGQRDLAKEKLWREILQRFSDSGKSRAQFCKEEGLKTDLFCYWSRVIPKRDAERQTKKPRSQKKATVDFVQVNVAEEANPKTAKPNKQLAVAQIDFSAGSVLLFENADFALLKGLLQALKETAQ